MSALKHKITILLKFFKFVVFFRTFQVERLLTLWLLVCAHSKTKRMKQSLSMTTLLDVMDSVVVISVFRDGFLAPQLCPTSKT